MRDNPSLHALALVFSLKASREPFSTEKLAREVLAAPTSWSSPRRPGSAT
jgi:hypothetical protein